MACNNCETGFQGGQTLVVTIQKSGTTALLYVQNQGRNIAEIKLILLCYTSGGGSGFLYLRPGSALPTVYSTPFIEPGLTALYYQLPNMSPGTIVQAQAEYIEIDGRSRSCTANF